MDPKFYIILHVFALFLLFTTVGALALHARNGGTKETNPSHRFVAILHGVALVLVLFAGFGLLAKMGQASPGGWGGWVYLKLGIWLVFGAMPVLFRKFPKAAVALWLGLPALAGVAVAVVKMGWLR